MKHIGIKKFVYYFLFWTLLVIVLVMIWMNLIKKVPLGINFIWYVFKPLLLVYSGAFWLLKDILWKWQCLYPWFIPFPNLNGKWKGILISNCEALDTSQKEIECELNIKQTLFHISCNMKTGESNSKSIVADFDIDKENQKLDLVYSYQNDPNLEVRHRSPIHYGTAMFQVVMENKIPIKLEGGYWTDRSTTGKIKLEKIQ